MCQPSSLGINAKTGIELTLPVELSLLATEGRRRRKLWGIPKRLHCPVIGTCLNVQELRRLASKVDPAGNRTANDYELHVNFVCAAETKNALSYEVHKELAIQKKCRQRHPLAALPRKGTHQGFGALGGPAGWDAAALLRSMACCAR